MVESCKLLPAWRALVKKTALALNYPIFDGPISLHIVFLFSRPKTHFNSKGLKPDAPHYYEYALSALKWLEYVPTEEDKEMFPELEPKYKQFLAMFTDKNVVLHDGEDMENSGDKGGPIPNTLTTDYG